MIDIHLLRENPDLFRRASQLKRINFDVDDFLQLDHRLRKAKQEFEDARAKQNALSKEIAKLSGDEKETKLQEAKELANVVKKLSDQVDALQKEWNDRIMHCPNPPDESVPVGVDDSENVEVLRCGEPKRTGVNHKDYLSGLRLLDQEGAAKISGSKFYFLRGTLALLHHAVLQYGIRFLLDKGFELVEPPHLVNSFAMFGTGYFPLGRDQTYELSEADPDKFLIGTSEVPVCALYSDAVLDEAELPLKLAGYSPCYRREAGSYGRDTAGLYRVHQFYKVEQVIICKPDKGESDAMHDMLLENSKQFVESLEIPYRVVAVCTGDLGLGQVKKHDIECWMPSRNGYGETHSCSSLHSFQARRLNIKVRTNSRTEYAYTLNNTLVASPRILIAYIENHLDGDNLYLAEPLRGYFGGMTQLNLKEGR